MRLGGYSFEPARCRSRAAAMFSHRSLGKHFFRGTLYFCDSYQLNSTLSRGQETLRLVQNPELNL